MADYHTRDMSDQLPATIKPQSLFDTGGYVSGGVALARMERLQALLVNSSGRAEVALEFGKDIQGLRFVRGSIKTELPLICQRCLKTMGYPITINLSLAMIVRPDQADNLPEAYEALLLDSTTLSLIALVEDELLLALPIVAMHPDNACSGRDKVSVVDEPVPEAKKPNPFAALAQLKGKLNSTQ